MTIFEAFKRVSKQSLQQSRNWSCFYFIVQRLLKVSWEEDQREEVKTGLITMLSAANSRLELSKPEHMKVTHEILEMIREFEKVWTIKIRATTKTIANFQSVDEKAVDASR